MTKLNIAPVTPDMVVRVQTVDHGEFRFTHREGRGIVIADIWYEGDTKHYDAYGNQWEGRYVAADPEGYCPCEIAPYATDEEFAAWINDWFTAYERRPAE